jgi:hypothetical protein
VIIGEIRVNDLWQIPATVLDVQQKTKVASRCCLSGLADFVAGVAARPVFFTGLSG